MTTNQALIDEIVTNVLARLQPAAVRPVASPVKPPTPVAVTQPTVPAMTPATAVASKPQIVELLTPVITADLLENAVKPGQALRIGRSSILTPSARDWLHSKRLTWTRQDRGTSSNGSSPTARSAWRLILQTVTPGVRALHEGLKNLTDGFKVELVGQPFEAAALATNLVSTAECDGVVIFTEHADAVACKANRNERVRAAVMQHSKQWELVTQTLGANVVCISPVGRTFIELRNLLRECAGTKPRVPAGF